MAGLVAGAQGCERRLAVVGSVLLSKVVVDVVCPPSEVPGTFFQTTSCVVEANVSSGARSRPWQKSHSITEFQREASSGRVLPDGLHLLQASRAMLPTRIAVICGAAALLSAAGLGSAAASAAACGAQAGCAQAEADGVGLLQHPAGRRPQAGAAEGRISPRSGAFTLGGKEVLLLGGNYVWKAAPYLPPLEVVERNAAEIAAGLRAAAYEPRPGADGEPRAKVPCVRLGAIFEAMMPEAGKVDAAWLQRLSQAIEAFGRHGVYVFLDAHSDAWSTTNGG